MFERFTERARQVVVLAQDEARTLKHAHLGTEHLLLGLLREDEGLAARVLDHLGVTLGPARDVVHRIVGVGDDNALSNTQIPFTPRAKKVLELTLREALSLGHNYIGTEHILLGLVRENEGVATRVLLDFGVHERNARNEVIRMLSGPGRQTRGSDAAAAVLPNGGTASNVYEAYNQGYAEGHKDADDGTCLKAPVEDDVTLAETNIAAHVEGDLELLDWAWGLLANVNEGDWEGTHPDWHTGVKLWREAWHERLGVSNPVKETAELEVRSDDDDVALFHITVYLDGNGKYDALIYNQQNADITDLTAGFDTPEDAVAVALHELRRTAMNECFIANGSL